MKRLIVLVSAVLWIGFMTSCGPGVPTKEIEDAKTSLERARAVDAKIYAAQDFGDAENDYNTANQFVEDKKNQEAKDKAISAKTKADSSYETARVKRAEEIVQKCKALLETADQNYAAKLYPTQFETAKSDLANLNTIYDAKDYDATYSNGMILQPKLQDLANNSVAEVEKVKNAIAAAQDKYDAAINKDFVKTYALEDLQKALPILDVARANLSNVDLNGAIAKAKEAEGIVDAAVKKAEDAYQKKMGQKKNQDGTIDLERQKEIELQKQKADDYINQAKQRLEKLRAKKTTGCLDLRLHEFSYTIPDFVQVMQNMGSDKPNTVSKPMDAQKDLTPDQSTNISEAMVEKNIQLAEDAYNDEEYLDAVDYAREAIRIADILLADMEQSTYTVKLNVNNRDCLWKISGYVYKNKTWLWPVIWRANKFQIQDPDLIYPGQKLKVPPALIEE